MPRPLPVERRGEHWWVEADGVEVRLSNLDKPYWPREGYTKGDLLAYYWNVAERILPYLASRPLTMKRMPDGADGAFFYEKNAPSHTPGWMPRCRVTSEDAAGGQIDYLMVDSTAALLFVANLGCIEFHPLHSRCATPELPDYLFFDLDPFPPATFDDVLVVALHVRAALEAIGLPSYPKTSGATGMQIYVPIESGPSYDEVRDFVGAVGRAIRAVDRERVTMEWEIAKRAGKVFIDHNMNRQGANIAAVYSVRPEPGASVSTPLRWDEVEDAEIRPGDFTIETVHDRIDEVGDLFAPVLSDPVDVGPALAAMGVAGGTTRRPAEDGEPSRASRRTSSPRRRGAGAPPVPEDRAGAPPRRTGTDAGTKLDEYLRKRDLGVTPEPGPGGGETSGDRFVIQKHNATRLHYDLRLERDGVLVSWAVPKGLPTTTGVRHLAVHTEDHPLEYATFEGWIPEGNYGAGEVRIFDSGRYDTLEWTDDKVSFRLHGTRHRGEYHLVKTKDDWLILLSKASAAEQPKPAPPDLLPMLATAGAEPFDDPAWRFEPKLDGVRTLAYVSPDATRLVSRRGRDQTAQYPELGRLAEQVNALDAVLDGEIVAVDANGRPSFELLQQRINLTSAADVDRVRRRVPVVLYAFDVLWLDGEDVTRLPLEQRRERLDAIVTEAGPLRTTLHVDGNGRSFFQASKDLGLEGVVAKRLGSTYQPGRRVQDWRKIKAVNRQDCVILGWTQGSGSRSTTFGALLLGAFDGDRLVWIGQVGTGFTERSAREVLETLEAMEASAPAVDDRELRHVKGVRWTRPDLVCEVEYLEFTAGGKLRAPSFKGLRPDKVPGDCEVPADAG